MPDSLATIATYWYASDADVARGALESAGIEAFVDDAHIVGVRGVKLRVRNEDAIRAGEVLDARCEWSGESEVPAEELPAEPPPCICEVCEPMRAARGLTFLFVAVLTVGLGLAFGASQAAFFALLAAAIYFLIADRWRCSECGASWN
jgi:hypothetical protein